MNNSELNDHLIDESYDKIISLLESKTIRNIEENFFLGISYYKTNKFENAEELFQDLNKNQPSNEITTYLIITKIKLDKLIEALSLYQNLCEKENVNIINYIKKNEFKNALNLSLFLKSIPLDLTPTKSKTDDLIELTNSFNYADLTLILAQRAQEN